MDWPFNNRYFISKFKPSESKKRSRGQEGERNYTDQRGGHRPHGAGLSQKNFVDEKRENHYC